MLTSGPRQPEQVWTQNYPPPVLKPHRCLWKWPHRKENRLIRRCHPYASKSASQAVLSKMQLTLHANRRTPPGASRLALAMSAWSVKTRRAPSRRCRDARVYGHTTTAMHDNEYSHPPSKPTRGSGGSSLPLAEHQPTTFEPACPRVPLRIHVHFLCACPCAGSFSSICFRPCFAKLNNFKPTPNTTPKPGIICIN